jgi:hypothetical protein
MDMFMNEKVYCVYDLWANTIIAGIAKHNNENYFFECIFSEEDDDWSDNYYLTLLDENIFELSLKGWEYWKQWRKQSIIPHPVTYAEKRKTMTMEEIFSEINVENDFIELTEKNYQNQIKIENYLKNNKPKFKAKGIFYGDITGINNTEVKWENIVEIN